MCQRFHEIQSAAVTVGTRESGAVAAMCFAGTSGLQGGVQ